MSRLGGLCYPIGERNADFADIVFVENIDVGDLAEYMGEDRRVDLRFIYGLISQTDEVIFASAKAAAGRWSRNLEISEEAGESFLEELGLKWPVYCPACDPCGEYEKMEVLAGRSVMGEVEVDKGMVIGRITPKKDPKTTMAWMTYNFFYRCKDDKCGAVYPIFYRDADDKQALEKTGFLKKSKKTDFKARCSFCGYMGPFDQYPMTNVGNFIWRKKFVKDLDLGDIPRDEMDIRYDWAVVCPKCRILFPTARNEVGDHDTKRYKKALVTKPVPRVYQQRYCTVCDFQRDDKPVKVGMSLDVGNVTHKITGQRFADVFLDSFYLCDNREGSCESIFALFPIEFLDYRK